MLVNFSYAQQEPLYTQYMFNPLNYNPAYAGSKSVLGAALVYRNQWMGIEDSPNTLTFSIHSPLKNKNMGVGFEVTHDEVGPTSNLWVQGSYAYRVKVSRISKGKLGFGLKAGLYRSSYDWSKISYKDSDDGNVGTTPETFTVPVFDFGLYYHRTNQSYAGLSVKNLNSPKYGLENPDRTSTLEAKLYTQLALTYGKIIEINERVVFRPSLLARTTFYSKPVADVNLSLLFDQIFWVGLSLRINQEIAAVVEYEISEQLKFGLSYDYGFNSLSTYSNGSIEVFLGFNYNVFKSRMRSPRYYF
jgi:type IX secretion system PorP/SprF family membrane protein